MTHWGESFDRRSHTLRLLAPDGTSRVLSLDRPDFTIGRDPDNDLVLDDPCVAPKHCRIVAVAGAPVLRDRGTRFGTTVNHVRCSEPTRLAEGDRIGVGGYILEVVLTRHQIDDERVAGPMRHTSGLTEQTPAALLTRVLDDAASSWQALGRPRRSLPEPPLLLRAAAHAAGHPLTPLTRVWLTAAATRRRRWQGLRWWSLGMMLGLGLATPLVASVPARTTPVTSPEAPPPLAAPPSPPSPKIMDVEHRVVPGETLASIAAYYLVDTRQIERWNRLAPASTLTPGTTLLVRSSVPPPRRSRQHHIVESGDTWANLAAHFGVTVEYLRASNPARGDRLQPGEWIAWEAIDLGTRGSYPTGRIEAPAESTPSVPIPASTEYDLRCAMNAYATGSTAGHLLTAIAYLRARLGYRGQLVLGDLSREDGGAFGTHLSHKTGHDVDIWLPHRAGYYREDAACSQCATRWCRPGLAEIDWHATWLLVSALRSTGAIRQIFLDRRLHDELREAARAAGVPADEVQRLIPPVGTGAALVLHADRHTRHIHVRFACDPGVTDCGG